MDPLTATLPADAPVTDGETVTASRRGRRAAPPANTDIARELRRRRELLRLSIRAAADRTGVSHTVINEIESGRRLPTVRTFERLRHGLGIDATAHILLRPPEPTEPLEVHLARLAACLWACGGAAQLVDLAAALGIPAAAVREQLSLVGPRLAACGIAVVTDGVEVRLEPLQVAVPAVGALGRLADAQRRAVVSEEAMAVLTYVGWHGEATRAQLEAFRGEDSETLLGRLVTAGLLATVRDSQGPRPNRYRLTTEAMLVMQVASPEELRAKLRPHVGDAALAKLGQLVGGSHPTVTATDAGVEMAGDNAHGSAPVAIVPPEHR